MKNNFIKPANFNVRTMEDLSKIRAWRDKFGYEVSAYMNFDGGGFNYFIVEFLSEDALNSFIENFSIYGEPWAEDAEGNRVGWFQNSKPEQSSNNKYEPRK